VVGRALHGGGGVVLRRSEQALYLVGRFLERMVGAGCFAAAGVHACVVLQGPIPTRVLWCVLVYLQWMAPEVLANQRYSNKADIYSFGMVMWECCARQVPFEGLNGVQAGEGRVTLLRGGWAGAAWWLAASRA
jgi:hypothetical protein